MLQPSTRRALALLLTAASIAFTAPAQQSLTFEVAIIKPSHAPNEGYKLYDTPDGYTGSNVSLYKLVQEAYGILDPKLLSGGPSWIEQDKFDLEAKFDPASIPDTKNLTYRQRADMLRPLLADRFHLKVHFETRDFPVYNLLLAKGGPKFQPTKPEATGGGKIGVTCTRSRRDVNQGCSMAYLADSLIYPSGRTVIDKTGLTGLYDYTEPKYSTDSIPANSPDAAYPSIFTALQEQLGLKLEPSTAPLDVLVIDSADHPSAN